jgi:nitrogen regulatory protein PII
MKKLEATISVANAPLVIEQLRRLEIENLTTSDVTVIDKHQTHKMIYRGAVYDDATSHRVKVELRVSEKDAPRAETLLAQTTA